MGEPSLDQYRKLVDLCYKAGRPEDAVKYLRRARALSPNSIEAVRRAEEIAREARGNRTINRSLLNAA